MLRSLTLAALFTVLAPMTSMADMGPTCFADLKGTGDEPGFSVTIEPTDYEGQISIQVRSNATNELKQKVANTAEIGAEGEYVAEYSYFAVYALPSENGFWSLDMRDRGEPSGLRVRPMQCSN